MSNVDLMQVPKYEAPEYPFREPVPAEGPNLALSVRLPAQPVTTHIAHRLMS